MGDQDLKPSVVWTKSYVEGFFCPRCKVPLVRAVSLVSTSGNEEYWRCQECGLILHVADYGYRVSLGVLDEIPEEMVDSVSELRIDLVKATR